MRYLVLLALVGCAHVDPPAPPPVVIPDSHELVAVPGKPGYLEISGGYLDEIFKQMSELEAALQKCQINQQPSK